MKKQIALAALVVAAILSGCNKDNNTNPTPNTPTTNIKVGTSWTFTMTDYDDSTGTQVVSTDDFTLTVVKDSTINNEKWFVATGPVNIIFRVGADGIYAIDSNINEMKYKFGNVNDSYTVHHSDGTTGTNKIVATAEQVTVPAGTFTAYKIESSDANSMEGYTWYSKDQFLIKQEEYDESPTNPGQMILDYKTELKSFTP